MLPLPILWYSEIWEHASETAGIILYNQNLILMQDKTSIYFQTLNIEPINLLLLLKTVLFYKHFYSTGRQEILVQQPSQKEIALPYSNMFKTFLTRIF